MREFLFPRQKWLTKKIRNSWMDKDSIMEIVVLECIKHYVEKENAIQYFEESQKNPEYPEHQKEFDREVKENYDLLTKRLPELELQLEKEWEDIVPRRPLFTFSKDSKLTYEQVYGRIDKLELEIENLQTKIMAWAINRRKSMWT